MSLLAMFPPRAPYYSAHIDNPWFPLPPGTTLHYSGAEDGHPGSEVLSVTHRTKVIVGVRATVVYDRVYLQGRLHENTFDYYAQDRGRTV